MPIKVTRRPYTECAWRWRLVVAGVSTGEGDVTDAMCQSLNGTFDLDFKACISQGNELVWASPCVLPDSDCGGTGTSDCCDTCFTVHIPEWDVDNGDGVLIHLDAQDIELSYFSSSATLTGTVCKWAAPPNTRNDQAQLTQSTGGSWGEFLIFLTPNVPSNAVRYVFSGSVGDACTTQTYTLVDPGFGSYPPTIEIESGLACQDVSVGFGASLSGGNSPCGPETSSQVKSKWRLTYSRYDELWVLKSYNRVDYPVYSLDDSDPCTGDEKILSLVTPPDSADNGCANRPPTVTITRVCPPDADETAFPRKLNKRTGKSRRLCGCDCQDQVVDLRFECEENCESTASAGCETWSEDHIECKYPASSDACTYCEEDKAPCAYEVMFECDIEHEGVSIAAKTVTLRHKCYFEKGKECDWVAVGPSPNPDDGPVGKQPVCATCADPCLSGCTWDAWTVGQCPSEYSECTTGPCTDGSYQGTWDVVFPAFTFECVGLYGSPYIINVADGTRVTLPGFLYGTDESGNAAWVGYVQQQVGYGANCAVMTVSRFAWPCAYVRTYNATMDSGSGCQDTIVYSFVSAGAYAPSFTPEPATLTVEKTP